MAALGLNLDINAGYWDSGRVDCEHEGSFWRAVPILAYLRVVVVISADAAVDASVAFPGGVALASASAAR